MTSTSFFQLPRALLAAAVFCALFQSLPSDRAAMAQSPPRVLRIEEDWELVVETSDANSVAPQVSCVFSPFNHLDSVYGCVELNHRNLPSFQGGGVQLQAWHADIATAFRDWENVSVIHTNEETIRWTQAMTLHDDRLIFQVVNGTSRTWGSFSRDGVLAIAMSTDSTLR